jgi:hypothetical protein
MTTDPSYCAPHDLSEVFDSQTPWHACLLSRERRECRIDQEQILSLKSQLFAISHGFRNEQNT